MAMTCRTVQELVNKTGNTITKRKKVIHKFPAYEEFGCFRQVVRKRAFESEVLQSSLETLRLIHNVTSDLGKNQILNNERINSFHYKTRVLTWKWLYKNVVFFFFSLSLSSEFINCCGINRLE
jgi:hypothetical protein